MPKYVSVSFYKDGKMRTYSRCMLKQDAQEVVKQFIRDGVSAGTAELSPARIREPDEWSYVSFHRRGGRGGPVPFP